MMGKEILAKILAIGITLILVIVLLSQIGIGTIIDTLSGINPIYLVLVFVACILHYFFKALRFKTLLYPRKVKLTDLFAIVCVHEMATSILPGRTGELSYIYLIKKTQDTSLGDGIATLAVARILDLVTVSLFFLTSVIFLAANFPTIAWGMASLGIFALVASALILAILMYYGKESASFFNKIALKLKLKKFRGIGFLLDKWEETTRSLEVIYSNKLIIPSFIASLLGWVFVYSMTYLLILGMGINLSIWAVIFATTFAILSFAIPIQSIAGFGVMEGAWTIGLMLLGFSKELAIVSGFSLHIIILIYDAMIGIFGMGMVKVREQV
jgi:hypothetical protein